MGAKQLMGHVDEGTLQAWIDGELIGEDQTFVEAHVAVCATCAAELRTLRDLDLRVHEVLGSVTGVPTPDPAILVQIHRRARSRGVARLIPASLMRAAVLLIALAGVVAAAIPGTPLRRWLEDVLAPEPDQPAIAPAPPSEPPVAPPAPAPLSGGSVLPSEGAVTVRLRSPASGVGIRLELTNDTRAWVQWSSANESVRSGTGTGWIEVRNVERGSVLVRIPRSVVQATLEVDGAVWWQKQGDDTVIPGPGQPLPNDTVIFAPRS
jgi:hypothetical protein